MATNETNVGHDVDTCPCRLCTKRREIIATDDRPRKPSPAPRDHRRGKPVVSKGCKGCHKKR